MFTRHKTSTALKGINYRYSKQDALVLNTFAKMWKRKCFPNPLPIVVDKREINKKIVKIYNDEGEAVHYKEILKRLFENTDEKALSDYYLLNYMNTKDGMVLNDFDFVPLFRYKFDSTIYVQNVTKDGVKKDKNFEPTPDKTIVNIFDFERIVVGSIFNGWLNSSTYFGEKPKSYKGSEYLWQMILTYRKAVYDYIYKSQTETLTCRMFDDMMYNSILLNIRSDEIKIRFEFHSSIKWKINIWFSLYNLFSNNNNNNIMASKVTELQAKMVAVAKGEANIETKEEFAFGAGQIVSYLIDRSAASNKTYALLEPYLQKSKSDQLQDAIAQTIAVYKHDISVYKGTFENLSSQVLTDDCNADMKPLLKYFLAGCFSPCAVYTKKDNSNNEQ
jgi:CRISPR-associated protein Csh1